MTGQEPIHIVGGGLAGCEAAFQVAKFNVPVVVHEMRPKKKTDVHKGSGLAELVCSNSFRSDDHKFNAVGILHQEMRILDSLILRAADATKVPAGGALAVDRDMFSSAVQMEIEKNPLITLSREEVTKIPDYWEQTIVATGPLTSPDLSSYIQCLTGESDLAFFDAIAPIIYLDSIDMNIAWFQSRYDKSNDGGDGKDYINCPLNDEEYDIFIDELLNGEKMSFHEWEKNTPYFEGCMPIEVMASRGRETLRWGPMKPVGLTNAHDQSRPHAVVQLRQDNALGTLYNMVGFQTKLKHKEQVRLFQLIPGLQSANFARLGGLHRNTFINSPRLLDNELRLRKSPKIRFAGQITGVEGYVESAAIGLLAGRMAASDFLNLNWKAPPLETAHGALLNHITRGANSDTFQPMNVNFGLFPALENVLAKKVKKGRERKAALAARALNFLEQWNNRFIIS